MLLLPVLRDMLYRGMQHCSVVRGGLETLCRYGILLLVVECMGASTVVTYGTWLLYSPVQEDFTADPHNPGKPKVHFPSGHPLLKWSPWVHL